MKRALFAAIAALFVLTGCTATAESAETGPQAVELCDQFDTDLFGMYANIVLDGKKDYAVALGYKANIEAAAAHAEGNVREGAYQLLDALPGDDRIHLIKSPLHDDSTVFADNVDYLKYQCEAEGYHWAWTP